METNQNPAQEQPAQLIHPETIQPETVQSEQQSASKQQPTPTAQRYNPAEAAEIVRHLTSGIFDPEYVLLFGSLADGTPHSDAKAYDLLIVVRETPDYNWMQMKRYLRYKMPFRRREISYINPYILTLDEVVLCNTPFLYFAHKEGELLYCKEHYRFRRPKRPCDFAAAYCDAKFHYDTFSTLGDQFLERANSEYTETRNMRMNAMFTAQAAVYFYHTLYFVYHGREFGTHDPVVMHERMRTLSAELMLVFDDSHAERIFILPVLRRFLLRACYDLKFDVAPRDLEIYMERVEQMGSIVRRLCELRLELYKQSSQ